MMDYVQSFATIERHGAFRAARMFINGSLVCITWPLRFGSKLYEPPYAKTRLLHMQKQRHRPFVFATYIAQLNSY